MKEFIKNGCIVFCIIFTILTLIHFYRGGELSPEIVNAFVFASLYSSVMSILLKDNETCSKRRIVIGQIVYISLIMLMVVGVTYYLGWQQSVFSVAVNLVLVIIIFVLIKYLLFIGDKKEAELMNEALQNRKKL